MGSDPTEPSRFNSVGSNETKRQYGRASMGAETGTLLREERQNSTRGAGQRTRGSKKVRSGGEGGPETMCPCVLVGNAKCRGFHPAMEPGRSMMLAVHLQENEIQRHESTRKLTGAKESWIIKGTTGERPECLPDNETGCQETSVNKVKSKNRALKAQKSWNSVGNETGSSEAQKPREEKRE